MKNAKQHLVDIGKEVIDGNHYTLAGELISKSEAREVSKSEIIIICSYGGAQYYPAPNSPKGQKWADKYPK